MTRRLLLSHLTLVVLVLLALEIPLGYYYTRWERERIVGEVEHSAEVLAAFVDEAIRAGQLDQLHLLATERAAQLDGRVVVVDRRGALLTSSHPLDAHEAVPAALPEIQAALRGEANVGVRTTRIGGVRSLSVAVPTQPGSTVRGAVRVTIPTATVNARVNQVWLSLAVAGLAVLAAAAVVAFALARWISRPVHALEQAAGRLADGHAAPAATTTGPPELRRLATVFNRTAARLQHLIRSQRAFAGHASHQLKTPLAALRLRLENLEPDISPTARGNLVAALTETDRLARMVEALLAMARLEEAPARAEPLDLDAAVEAGMRTWTPLADRHGVLLTATGGPVGRVWAVPGAVEQIIDNLLANALSVAPAGSTVTIDRVPAVEAHRWVRLRVVDRGPGLSPEHRQRAFERFWRAPGAPKGGTGLGLALVRQLSEAGGGQVRLDAAPGGGVDAVVTLRPCAPAPAGAAA